MANQGTHIRDVHSLEELDEKIKESGEKMANIDQDVSNYLNNVKDDLESQLDFLHEKLEEAEDRLREAESAASSCHASQIFVPEMGGYVPTCISEEAEEVSARENANEWRNKYNEGKQIVEECQREISEYESGGHVLIEKMANNQTPKASENLRRCISKLQEILATDFLGLQNNLDVTFGLSSYTPSESLSGDSRFDAFRESIRRKKE